MLSLKETEGFSLDGVLDVVRAREFPLSTHYYTQANLSQIKTPICVVKKKISPPKIQFVQVSHLMVSLEPLMKITLGSHRLEFYKFELKSTKTDEKLSYKKQN